MSQKSIIFQPVIGRLQGAELSIKTSRQSDRDLPLINTYTITSRRYTSREMRGQ